MLSRCICQQFYLLIVMNKIRILKQLDSYKIFLLIFQVAASRTQVGRSWPVSRTFDASSLALETKI